MNNELPSNAQIYLLLLSKIHIKELCSKIIYIKTNIELKESMLYHIERWETISSKYFRSLEYDYNHPEVAGRSGLDSYVIDDKYYIVKPDKLLDYYNETHSSYQVRHLLMDILSVDDGYFRPYHHNVDNISILNGDYNEYRKSKDKPYSILSKLITNTFN